MIAMCLVLDEQQQRKLRRLFLEKKMADEVEAIIDGLVEKLIDRDALKQALAEIETLYREILWKELAPASSTGGSLPVVSAPAASRPAASEPQAADDDGLTVVVDGKRYPIIFVDA